MATTLQFKDVFDKDDHAQLEDMIIRMATRIYTKTEGGVPEPVCNPSAMQMLIGYLQFLSKRICDKEGISIDVLGSMDVTDPDVFRLGKKTRH